MPVDGGDKRFINQKGVSPYVRSQARSPPLLWLGFLTIGLLNLVDGLVLSIAGAEAEQDTIKRMLGMSWDELSQSNPSFAHYVNAQTMIIGLLLFGFSLFIVTVSVTGYRRGHKWAWYAMWNTTVYYVLTSLILFSEGEVFTSDALTPELLVFCLLGTVLFQLMGYPRFFPRTGREGTKSPSGR